MKYTKYGITLSFMKEVDLEMVRQWRNDPNVVRNYEFREYITPEMQKEWFKSINNINNFYGIIEYSGKKIGVINLKNIDWKNHTGESGIFFPDPKYHNTSLPAILVFMTAEIQFSFFKWNIVYAHILKDNKPVQSLLRNLGFELCQGEEENFNQKYFNTQESFEKHSEKIKKAVKLLTNNDETSTFLVEPSEFNDTLYQQWETALLSYVKPDKVEETEAGRIYYFS
jgi:RimJ/RimL family protein N-acetyltransferase